MNNFKIHVPIKNNKQLLGGNKPIIVSDMKPNIFEYTNYRDFLKDSYAHMKEDKPGFSHRFFAKKAGLASPGCLHKVIKGERNLSRDNIQKFSFALGLTKKEQQYFDILVSFNNAKSPEAKRYYIELLHNLKKKKTGMPLADEQFEFYSNWYGPAIIELINLPGFSEDPNWIRAKFGNKITNKQVTNVLETIQKLGLIKRDETGTLKRNNEFAATGDEAQHTAAIFFHQQMLSVANDKLFITPRDEREIEGITMAVSKKQFKEVQSKIREFNDTIMNYLETNTDVPETVMQLHTLFFPLTSSSNGGGK